VGSILPAAELVVRDLQADLIVLPTAFRYQVESPTVSTDGDDHFKSGTGLRFGGRRSVTGAGDAVGLVVGADVVSDTWTYASSGFLWGYGVHASAGLGWAINDRWTLVLEPGIGTGFNRMTLPSTRSGPGLTTNGRWLGWDFRLNAGWQATEQMVLRFHLGWMTAKHSEQESEGITDTLTPSGVMVGIGFAWRLSNAPEPLR
jgi:hypothetical protein